MANVGSLDRLFRIILGAVLLVGPFLPPLAGLLAGWGVFRFVLPVIGLVLIGTGMMRFCPLYALFGIRTCPLGKS